MRQEVEIIIDPLSGEMSSKVVTGPGGALCETMLEQLFDQKPSGTKKLPEYYQKRVTVGKTKQKRG